MGNVVIYGAGGHARELAFQLVQKGEVIAALVDDLGPGRHLQNVPVLKFEDAFRLNPSAIWHVAIGDMAARSRILRKLGELGIKVGGFISDRALIAPSSSVEPSAQIFGNSVVSDEASIGNNVIINFGCVISHNVHIGENSVIAPRVAIGGNVEIGRLVWIGIGAIISNGQPDGPLRIGDGAVIGAGACVIKDVEAGMVVVGVPARAIRRNTK
jgi:sugar O-acyltransferase (sialic acid O-acetyltransferase NeuD family)